MTLSQSELFRLHNAITPKLEEISTLFKAAKMTLIVRAPDLADSDLIMTDDNLPDAIAAIQRLHNRHS